MSRTTSKISQLTDRCCIASSGCNADQVTLHKLLKFRIKMYGHQHEKQMSTPAIGQMLSTMLYGRRMFPYYTFNVVGGLDEKGEGCVFSYDAIGCIERLKYAATGTGSALIEPFLDNMVAYKNTDLKPTISRSVVKRDFTRMSCKHLNSARTHLQCMGDITSQKVAHIVRF
jgi:20S proteasome subunit beta 6